MSNLEYNHPLESIQNKTGQMSQYGTSDIDKKIQEIRKKYQEYQKESSSGYSRLASRSTFDENSSRGVVQNSGEGNYLDFIRDRKSI